MKAVRGFLLRLALTCITVAPVLPLAAEQPAAEGLAADRLEALLAEAPTAGAPDSARRPAIRLPTADGTRERFAVEEISVMEAGLAARFPRIKTYRGIGLDDPTALARLDLTPQGFHGMILSSAGTVLVEPDEGAPREGSRIVRHQQQTGERNLWQCATPPRKRDENAASPMMRPNGAIAGGQIRTYRIAIATTAEYTAFHGGTVESALAEVVTVLNRIDGILERDLAIRLVLVDGNDQLIYTDPESDPYNNDDASQMTGQNQDNLDRVIGSENYDIGHVFGTYPQGRGGGMACVAGRKARGYSGLPRPTTEFFAIQLVVHEIGHQFSANHTYNGTTRSCERWRNARTAWEPGSGSTIMSYAGVCAEENVAQRGDDYFHTGSLDEILDYVTSGAGATCGEVTQSENRPPTANAGRRYKIPAETPFELAGRGSDPDGDALTYVWEQFDLGPPSPPLADDGMRPLFRSYPPVAEPTRVIPRVEDLRRGKTTIKEILPTTTRKLTFRLTVRDGRGGVAHDTVQLRVTNRAGPFRVVEPRKGDVWTTGGQQTVEWKVARTSRRPIRCRRVDLWLSSDGGRSFPRLLWANTPNDGYESVTVPAVPTGKARVKVACANNIFFAISSGNFRIRQ